MTKAWNGRRTSAAILLTIIVSACSGAGGNKRYVPMNAPACENEVELAARSAAQVEAQWSMWTTFSPVQASVQRMGERLAGDVGTFQYKDNAVNIATLRRWRFDVLKDASVNAFSVGDGRIYITEGMLRFVKNEAQLMGVISHEFGHYIAQHFCRKRRSKIDDKDVQLVKGLLHVFDLEREVQADRWSARLLYLAGYKPSEALIHAAYMSKIQRGSDAQQDDRVQLLKDFIFDMSDQSGVFDKQLGEYRTMKNALSANE